MTIQKYVKDNMQEYRVYRQRLLSEALDTMCHWSFHETLDALQHSTEFYKAKQFLEQNWSCPGNSLSEAAPTARLVK